MALLALGAASGRVLWAQNPRENLQQESHVPSSLRGKQLFTSTCAGCHGLDGRGGERAPNVAETPKVQRLSDTQIFHIVESGIPGTGMPAFHSLESSDIKALVAYLRTLQGSKIAIKLPGDPVRGETIFSGKAGCSACHMVAGKGGFIASDLSEYARTHSVEQARTAITDPLPGDDPRTRMATATTRAGETLVGRIRDEDNFSLQLQTLDGAFHFVAKSDLASLGSEARPLMPSDYGSRLSSGELNDVVSYLMSTANRGSKTPAKQVDEEE